MAARKIDKSQWQPYFDQLSDQVVEDEAEIEVASLPLGDQIQAEWVPLLGITYDRKGDLLEVALDGLDHLISHPREITVEDGSGSLASIEVIDGQGTKQIIRLRAPLLLPQPAR